MTQETIDPKRYKCPSCEAMPWEPCVTGVYDVPGKGEPVPYVHKARRDKAEARA